jgi:hypothetical protein
MGTGGERYGAGRPGWRRKCEYSLPLDIRQLVKRKLLMPGLTYGWNWSSGTEPAGSVGVRVESDRVILSYQRTGTGKSQQSSLWLDRCAGGYGARRMFACPWCGKRIAIVYFGAGGFACRSCLRLAYASEAESTMDRLWRKQRKIERRLAGGAGDWDGWKPKGMHQTTFDRLTEKIDQIEQDKDVVFAVQFAPLMRRLGLSVFDL